MFIIQKFEKPVCEAVHLVMVNEIKSSIFFFFCKIVGGNISPKKGYISYAIHFLYVSQKKSQNKLCLELHDRYILSRMFFSHVIIKYIFFLLSSDPLNNHGTLAGRQLTT